jgi:hypothetical protein
VTRRKVGERRFRRKEEAAGKHLFIVAERERKRLVAALSMNHSVLPASCRRK